MSHKMLHQNWSEFDPEDGGSLLCSPCCTSARLHGITVQKATSETKLLWAHFESPLHYYRARVPPNLVRHQLEHIRSVYCYWPGKCHLPRL